MNWLDLLFIHYPVPTSSIRHLIPESLKVQEHSGSTWVGIVPFYMTGVSGRWIPDVPGFSEFAELNVRFYVEREGKPGVFFLSLDAANRLAVWGAQTFFHLPYRNADMLVRRNGEEIEYRSRRRESNDHSEFIARYAPTSPVYEAEPGSLESFLTERYCLYADAGNSIKRLEIQHVKWPLQKAECTIEKNTLLDGVSIRLPDTKPLLHFARGVKVACFLPETLPK